MGRTVQVNQGEDWSAGHLLDGLDSTVEEAPAQGSLAGDISEIYYDLRQNLQLEEREIPRADLLWELRESFREHWGRHALETLKAIHNLHL
jgi:hypothetical protein